MPEITENRLIRVVIPYPPYRALTYSVPESLSEMPEIGQRVIVPLANRRVTGFVTEYLTEQDVPNVRDIVEIPDAFPLFTPEMLELTAWTARYYMASWGEVIRAALPPALHKKSSQRIHVLHPLKEELLSLREKELLDFLISKDKISVQALKNQYLRSVTAELTSLHQKGLIDIRHEIPSAKIKQQTERWIRLKQMPDAEELVRLQKRAPKQCEILNRLPNNESVSQKDLNINSVIINVLQKKGWIEIEERSVMRDPFQSLEIPPEKPMQLTGEQKNALEQILSAVDQNIHRTFLLHGVTGSGKTQVYLEALRHVVSQGKTALVLIPEISLTPQAVQRYRSLFGNKVAVLHSRMSDGERLDAWHQLRHGQCHIALGPRSVIFAPIQNLGLIVVDEEHEATYKQIDPAPRYHARDLAVLRGQMNSCPVILGSATPSLESYYNALQGKYTLCELKERIDCVPMPDIELVNTRQASQDQRILSMSLQNALQQVIANREQAILLQNRRGYSVFLQCKECGHIEACEACDISMTYHKKHHKLLCHYCGAEKSAPDECSACQSRELVYRGVGTQRVEEELTASVPDARIVRMDLDTTRTKNAHADIITRFDHHEADILLGTQMVAKGHDFNKVSLVGIISADTGLFFPDFRSGERTFQLLTQAAGRAGRRQKQGRVVIQSFQAENPVLQFVLTHDYPAFYAYEIEHRKDLGYPPFGRLALIRFRGSSKQEVERSAKTFRKLIAPHRGLEILGPVESPIARIREQYRHQLILRIPKSLDKNGQILRNTIQQTWDAYHHSHASVQVRISVDIDPVDVI